MGGIASISSMETKLCGFSSSSRPFELNTCVDVWNMSSMIWEFRCIFLGVVNRPLKDKYVSTVFLELTSYIIVPGKDSHY